jgi:hypothetical protein
MPIMIALLYLLFFSLYGVVVFFISLWAYRIAQKYGQRGRWGATLAALLLLGPIFWDWLPTLALHQYYCAKDAGYWQYQSPQQWLAQHPEARGEDWSRLYRAHGKTGPLQDINKNTFRSWASRWMYVEQTESIMWFETISRREQKLVSAKENIVIARSVDYFRGKKNMFSVATPENFSDYKIWLSAGNRTCINGHDNPEYGRKIWITRKEISSLLREGEKQIKSHSFPK